MQLQYDLALASLISFKAPFTQPPIKASLSFCVHACLQDENVSVRVISKTSFMQYYLKRKIIPIQQILLAKHLQCTSMNWTQIIGLSAGVLTACSLLPQVIKTLKEKQADDVSLVMLFVLQAGLILWIAYGIKRSDLPIIVTNSFSLLVNIVMVILRIRYRR